MVIALVAEAPTDAVVATPGCACTNVFPEYTLSADDGANVNDMNPFTSRRLRSSFFSCTATWEFGARVTIVPSIKRMVAAVAPATTLSPAIMGHDDTPAAVTLAPLS